MIRILFIAACTLLAGLHGLPVSAEEAATGGKREFPLRYRLAADISQEVYCGGQYLTPTASKSKFTEEPPYLSKEPLYATVKLGVKKDAFHVVLDSSTGENRGYDVLYVDADRDGRITSAEKLSGVNASHGSRFGPIKLMVKCCDEEICPQWFTFQLTEYEDREAGSDNVFRPQIHRHLHINNTGYYQGLVGFGDEKRLLAFIDSDGDGLYNHCMKGANQNCDRLAVDYNGDGKLDAGYDAEEAQPLSRYVYIADRFWQIDVAADGSAVTVEPLDKPVASIRSNVREYTLLLTGADGAFRVRGQDGTAKVPAGTWGVAHCKYRIIDSAGQRWDFAAHAATPRSIQAPPGGEVKIPFGPPLTPKVVSTGPTDGQLTLNLQLTGSGGEVYQDVSLADHRRPPVPKVKILDADDKEVALLDFHYG